MSSGEKARNAFWRTVDVGLHLVADRTVNRFVQSGDGTRPRLIKDIPYVDDGSPTHLLDVWLPAPKPGPTPVVVYLHGGAFAIGSKNSHRIAGRKFASRGYLTFVINYRLAPRYAYPASIEDCCTALCWIWDHLAHFGGDPEHLIIAGESAGGNLAAVLGMVNSYKRPEPFCRAVWDRNITPRGVIPFCGWHEPTSHEHYGVLPAASRTVPILQALARWIFGHEVLTDPESAPLLSALKIAETPPDRPLPPFLVAVGTMDPLFPDSVALKRALQTHGVDVTFCAHENALHAHHLIPFTPGSRQVWRDVELFLSGLTPAAQKAG